jgi:hypothetical protein
MHTYSGLESNSYLSDKLKASNFPGNGDSRSEEREILLRAEDLLDSSSPLMNKELDYRGMKPIVVFWWIKMLPLAHAIRSSFELGGADLEVHVRIRFHFPGPTQPEIHLTTLRFPQEWTRAGMETQFIDSLKKECLLHRHPFVLALPEFDPRERHEPSDLSRGRLSLEGEKGAVSLSEKTLRPRREELF